MNARAVTVGEALSASRLPGQSDVVTTFAARAAFRVITQRRPAPARPIGRYS